MTVHRAIVVSGQDPEGRGRLQVESPEFGWTRWASRVFPIAAFTAHDVPSGIQVWIDFEDDDRDRPVVLGLVEQPSRRERLGRDLEMMGDAWDHGHAAGSADASRGASGGVTANPYR